MRNEFVRKRDFDDERSHEKNKRIRNEQERRLRKELAYARQASGDPESATAEFIQLTAQPGEFQAPAQAAIDALRNAVSPADAKSHKLLERGYAALSKGDKVAARVQFEAAVKL